MAAYMSMRVGRNLRENSIIAAIEREIYEFFTKEELRVFVGHVGPCATIGDRTDYWDSSRSHYIPFQI